MNPLELKFVILTSLCIASGTGSTTLFPRKEDPGAAPDVIIKRNVDVIRQ
jgi:hypothetical protein